VLRLASDGSWFQQPGEAECSLRTRLALKRLLRGLADAHPEGNTISVTDLFAIGWPGERARRDAAARRVYVAISSLRKLGLDLWIERHSEGYRLTGTVHIVDG
jgi:hypothetical protein